MAAKVRLVVGDQNSLELQALERSFNSLLLILQNIAAEEAAATTSAVEAAAALSNALSTGKDTDTTNHTGTQRLVYGIRPTPTHPQRRAEVVTELQTMQSSDTF